LRKLALTIIIALVASLGFSTLIPLTQTNTAQAASGDIVAAMGINGHIATRYGIYRDAGSPMGMLANTGSRWDREEFRWDVVEKNPGKWDWGFTDDVVSAAQGRGVNVLGLLCYSVGWATPGGGYGYDQPAHAMPDLNAWANYVSQVVNRYKGRVEYWEIWNEENHPIFFRNPDPAAYTQILRAAYQAVKQADPSARVVLGGLAGADVSYMEGIYQNGGWDSFDILGVHPYVAPKSPEAGGLVSAELAKTKAFIDRHGGGKPIWVTELGWPASSGPWGVRSDDVQAEYLVRGLIEAASAPGVERVFWYNLRNDGNDYGNDELNYGLLQSDWRSPKRAYSAFQALTARLSGASFVGTFDLEESRKTIISDFEADQSWKPWGSGASGFLTRTGEMAHGGTCSGKLGYAFDWGGKDYLDVSIQKQLSGQPNKIGAWIYGDNSGHILWATILDATGERFMVRLGNIGAGWQLMEAKLGNYFVHEAGNNDGVIDYPIRFNSLIIDNDPDGTGGSGSIYVDDLFSEEGPAFFGYRFQKGDHNVDVLWTDGPGETVSLPTSSGAATVYDIYGGSQTVGANGGALQLAVGDQPIYVEHQGGSFATPNAPSPGLTADSFADPSMRAVWERTDSAMVNGGARSWYWGPAPWKQQQESYTNSPGGSRLVEYFDKSRMEVNDPNADRNSQWFVTNGLLVKEMVSGKIQVGDGPNDVEWRSPAEIAVAGDPIEINESAPTYRSLQGLCSLNNDRRAEPRLGQLVTQATNRSGNTWDDPALAGYGGTNIAYYDNDLGHNIPAVFWNFLNAQGPLLQNGQVVQSTVINWVFVTGLPISEPYWTKVKVGGVEKDVLIQAFERRFLTYTPGNAPGWQVEMGNVGQHYFAWRYPDQSHPWF
jgi:polysaccharide biosynthesis protein PslG